MCSNSTRSDSLQGGEVRESIILKRQHTNSNKYHNNKHNLMSNTGSGSLVPSEARATMILERLHASSNKCQTKTTTATNNIMSIPGSDSLVPDEARASVIQKVKTPPAEGPRGVRATVKATAAATRPGQEGAPAP